MPPADPALTYSEVATRLGCSERHVFRLVADGLLAAEPKVAGHRRIRESEVDRYLADRYPGLRMIAHERRRQEDSDTMADDRKDTG